MPTFTFNQDLAKQITSIISTPKTAREIAKEIGQDKHIINQHLYKMSNVAKTDDKVPIWSILDTGVLPCHHDGVVIGYTRTGVLGIYRTPASVPIVGF